MTHSEQVAPSAQAVLVRKGGEGDGSVILTRDEWDVLAAYIYALEGDNAQAQRKLREAAERLASVR